MWVCICKGIFSQFNTDGIIYTPYRFSLLFLKGLIWDREASLHQELCFWECRCVRVCLSVWEVRLERNYANDGSCFSIYTSYTVLT